VKEGTLTSALEKADLPAPATALRRDVVFHSPILATVADEVRGHAVVVKALGDGARLYGAAPERGGMSEPGRAIHRHVRRSH
jgi:hypothetical protein